MKLKVLLLSIAIGCMSMVSHAMDWSEKPFRVVQQAAEKGNAAAQYSLASMYAQGRGVGQDLKQAMQWYKKAAEQGDSDAQNNLDTMFTDEQAGNDKTAQENSN